MSDLYLRFFQEVEYFAGSLWSDCIVLVEYSSSISQEEALLKAQKQLVNDDFIITKIEFPYIRCRKFEILAKEI